MRFPWASSRVIGSFLQQEAKPVGELNWADLAVSIVSRDFLMDAIFSSAFAL
jgi:hypothetical protein